MKIKKYLLLLLLTFSISNCGDSDKDPIIISRTADDVKNDFQNLSIQPGINDITLESAVSEVFWSFRIIAPSEASEINKRPLIISLHGGASNLIPDAHTFTDCLVEPVFEPLNAYIIRPNSSGSFWYEQSNQVQVLALLDLAKTYLFVDHDKTLVTGYSDGGNGSWFFAEYYSELFSASIPMASSYNTIGTNGVATQIDTPLYVIHGENDELFPLSQTQEWVNESKNAGNEITFVIADGLGHLDYCDYLDYLKDAANWVQTDVWNN